MGTTSFIFNLTAATFTVVSNTEIKTTVPSGATTGKVKVTTPSRTLTSDVNFRVTPQITSFSPTSALRARASPLTVRASQEQRV